MSAGSWPDGDPWGGSPGSWPPDRGTTGGTSSGGTTGGGNTGGAEEPVGTASRTTVHLLTLGSHLQAGSFETFAREHYLPALRAAGGRRGGAGGVRLLRRRRESGTDALDLDRQFLLLVEGGVPLDEVLRVEDATVQRRLDAYAPQVVPLGGFEQVDQVHADTDTEGVLGR